MKLKIFLSYARDDKPVADRIRRLLSDWGHTPWMDVYDIPKGAYWPDEIDRALNEADVVIGILSPRVVASRNVKNEWDWCIVYHRRLILLQYEPAYVPENYISLNRIDCVGTRFESGTSDLRAALAVGRTFSATAFADSYQEYLRSLYERVNRFLAQKIVPSLTADERDPQPLRLSVRSEVDAVDALFARRNDVDPLFIVAGLESEASPDVFQDVWEAFNHYTHRLLLLGSPGAGKTFTLLHACRDAVVRRMRDTSAPLPIFCIISTWDIKQRPPLEEWLEASYGAPADVRRLLEEGQALLLLDGLDELGGASQDSDPRADFLDRLPLNNEVLITCRELDYKQIGHKAQLAGAVTLMPLTDDQIRQMVDRQPRLEAMIESDISLKEALRTPLLLSLFAFVCGGDSDDLPDAFLQGADSLPEIRDRILKAYLEKRHLHEVSKWKFQTPPPHSIYSLDDVYDVLGNACMLASDLTSEAYRENAIPTHRIASAYQHIVLRERKEMWSSQEGLRVWEEARHFITFALRLNLLVEIGEMFDEPLYALIHKLFFDHFAFVYALKHVADGRLYHDIMSNKPTTILARLGDRRAVASLIEALKSDNLYIRFSAADALGVLGDAAALDPLIMALKDSDALVRISAAVALGKLGAPRAVEPLAARLTDWEEGYFRLVCNAAAEALEKIGTPEALATVREARSKGLLKDDPPFEW